MQAMIGLWLLLCLGAGALAGCDGNTRPAVLPASGGGNGSAD